MLLAVSLLTLASCSTETSDEAWPYEYERHSNIVKATAASQRGILHLDGEESCIIPGVVLWPYLSGPWIARVNRAVEKADLRAGDRILGVNGGYVRNLGVLLLKLSHLHSSDSVELTLERDHELRRVTVRCGDSAPIFSATARLLQAAAAGDWQQCLELAADLPSIAQVNYSWAAQLKYDCNEALRLLAHRKPNAADATLAHQWARLRLDEAKDIPGGIDQVRWNVTDMIYWLRRYNFDRLAGDLADHLDAYSPDRW